MLAISHPARHGVARCLSALACALALAGPALAADASLDQVYQAAHAGHVEQALQMMDPVLRDHPNSAKAHYVEADLLAQRGRFGPARTELATAERLAPGLPFVQDQSLQHLRRVLDQSPAAVDSRSPLTMPAAEAASPGHGRPLAWGLALAVAFGGLLGWLLTRANRPRPAPQQGPAMAQMAAAGPSMAWPRNPAVADGVVPWGGAPAAPAPAGPGWGSQVAAGVAGGLAAGAAAVAGQELGRRLFGHETVPAPAPAPFTAPPVQAAPAANGWDDPDFGIRDAAGGWGDGPDVDADAGGLGGNWDV